MTTFAWFAFICARCGKRRQQGRRGRGKGWVCTDCTGGKR